MPARSKTLPPALKPPEEKITVNVGPVDLGQIDLLVREGFYSSRSDLIRTAIRKQLAVHGDTLDRAVERHALVLGILQVTRDDLAAAKASGSVLNLRVVGLANIAADVPPDLARATIASVTVLGAFHASPAVKSALADRIR